MFSQNAFVTEMNAQEVADAIQEFYRSTSEEQYFKLVIVDEARNFRRELWVRPMLTEAPHTLANGDQLVHCVSNCGNKLDIIVPAGMHREFMPATVILADSPHP